jgi:O-antigen ligase
MKLSNRVRTLREKQKKYDQYPLSGILIVVALLLAGPFVSRLLAFGAFAICLYRIVKFDSRVFAADYCFLLPLSPLFQAPNGMSLMVYVCLLAAIWYFVRNGIRADISYVMLIVLMNYMVARMQMNISRFVLCFGQLFMLCVILPKQDTESAERAAKLFCMSVILSSVYALVFRSTPQLRALRGNEAPAYWGSVLNRFYGIFEDPNYYMTLLIIGLAMLIKLRDCERITRLPFWTMTIGMIVFGILTYSKTFFVVLVLLVAVYIVWQFRNRRYLYGSIIIFAILALGSTLLFAKDSPFAVVMTRLTSANNISDLTTGRTDLFAKYLEAITDNVLSLLFGAGMAARNLGRDPHNLYLEITYYTGAVGLVLFACYYWGMVRVMKRRTAQMRKQNLIARYVVVFMVLTLYFTLHGMFAVVSYGGFFMAFLSMLLVKKKEAK